MRRVTLYDHPDVFACEEDGVVYEMPTAYEYMHGLLPLEQQIVADKMMLVELEEVLASEEKDVEKYLAIKARCIQRGDDPEECDEDFRGVLDETYCEIAKAKHDIAKLNAHMENCYALLAKQNDDSKK